MATNKSFFVETREGRYGNEDVPRWGNIILTAIGALLALILVFGCFTVISAEQITGTSLFTISL